MLRHKQQTRSPLRIAASIALALGLALSFLAFNTAGAAANGGSYEQTNLVSDQSGVARVTDPNLVNAWGISFGPTTPIWVANNGTGTSTLYDGNGNPFPLASPLVVNIP